MSSNEFESKLDKERQINKEESNIEFRTKIAVLLPPVTKEIC